jgi:hypothetical protein
MKFRYKLLLGVILGFAFVLCGFWCVSEIARR